MSPIYSTFLSSSQLTTNIHWLCYYIVHIYVDIHFCDSMSSFNLILIRLVFFFSGSEPFQDFNRLYKKNIYLSLEIKLWRGEGRVPLNGLTRLLFVPVDLQHHMSIFCLFVQWAKLQGDSSFCWYWWNCWQSIFNLSNHSKPELLGFYINHCYFFSTFVNNS
jgi:hypothetical protein